MSGRSAPRHGLPRSTATLNTQRLIMLALRQEPMTLTELSRVCSIERKRLQCALENLVAWQLVIPLTEAVPTDDAGRRLTAYRRAASWEVERAVA